MPVPGVCRYHTRFDGPAFRWCALPAGAPRPMLVTLAREDPDNVHGFEA